MDLKCVICQAGVCGEGEEYGGESGRDATAAFDLFCSLLEIRDSLATPGGCVEGRGEDGIDGNMFCNACTGALKEILRVEKVIENLKIAQLVHVNTLKRTLLRSASSRLSEASTGVATNMPVQYSETGYRSVLRNQLINCLQRQNRRNNDNHSNAVTLLVQEVPKVKPCSVQLTRLNLDKLNRPPNNCNTLVSPVSPGTATSWDPQPSSSQTVPGKRLELSVKHEPDDDEGQHYEPDNLTEYDNSAEQDVFLSHNHSDFPAPISKPVDETGFYCRRKGVSVFFLNEDIYLYRCTVIKFLPCERQYHCQEPNCLSPSIPGSFLDGSLVSNLKSHVDSNHSSSNYVVDGHLRLCPLCPTTISGSQEDFRGHFVDQHSSCSRRGLDKNVCLICGKPGYAAGLRSHLWTHKSRQEQREAVTAGETVPHNFKKFFQLENPVQRDPLAIPTVSKSVAGRELSQAKSHRKRRQVETLISDRGNKTAKQGTVLDSSPVFVKPEPDNM